MGWNGYNCKCSRNVRIFSFLERFPLIFMYTKFGYILWDYDSLYGFSLRNCYVSGDWEYLMSQSIFSTVGSCFKIHAGQSVRYAHRPVGLCLSASLGLCFFCRRFIFNGAFHFRGAVEISIPLPVSRRSASSPSPSPSPSPSQSPSLSSSPPPRHRLPLAVAVTVRVTVVVRVWPNQVRRRLHGRVA
jgi:hypothetical protein